jgi:glycosyltransferase involved in cell wall biosynthesis
MGKSTNNKIKISVVMPTFNEEQALPLVVCDIKKHTQEYETEILIVDSSTDNTPKVAKNLGVKVISQPPQGHGVALQSAILAASGDYIITADCDDTYPMESIHEFVDLMTSHKFDLVSGNRLGTSEVRNAMPSANLWANRIFAFLVRVIYGVSTYDVTTGMFGFKREVVHAINWETNYSFPSEIIIRTNLAGYRHKEIPIAYRNRVGEVTLNRWHSGKAYLRCFLKYRFNLNISPKKL